MRKIVKDIIKRGISSVFSDSRGLTKVKTLSGPAKGTVFRLDLLKESSYWVGSYDKWILDRVVLKDILKPGWVVWDCGAYVGYYTAIFRNLIGPNGFVYTFEASTTNYNRLKELPELNNWSNVKIINEAVGPDHTTIKFVSNLGGASGPADMSKEYDMNQKMEYEEVICRGVDELVLECEIKAPNFIKFDLESAEVFALCNGNYVFSKVRPYILLELHGKDCHAAAASFLSKFNYKAKDVYYYNDRTNPGYLNAEQFLAETYTPHMLYCEPLNY
jgi:FkbM family methyltransferase